MIEKLNNFPMCYVCGDNNEIGYNQDIFFNTETKKVFTKYNSQKLHCGYNNIIHGGIFLTFLDEVMAWNAIKITNHICLTVKMNTSFVKKATTGKIYIIESEISKSKSKLIFTKGVVKDKSGEIYYKSDGIYIKENPV